MTDADRRLDRLLTEDGARWRAAQPPAPDPVPPAGPRRPRWQPIAAAVAVVALAAGIVAVATFRHPAHPPPATGPTATPRPTEQVVRDGDTVRGAGQVVALPGRPVRLCGRHVVNLLPGEDDVVPAYCPVGVTLVGANLDQLTDRRARAGAVWGYGRYIGTYRDRTLTVTRQEPPPPQASPPPPRADLPADCPAPPGGWSGDIQGDPDIARVQAWLAKNTGVAASVSIARPTDEGIPTVLLVGTTGDVEQARREIRQLYSGSLCVRRVRHSDLDARTAMATINRAMQDPTLRARYGICLQAMEGVDAGEPWVNYTVMVYDEAAHEFAVSVGTDLLLVESQVKRVG